MQHIKLLLAPSMLLYIAVVVLLNVGFSYVPLIDTFVGMASPMAIVAGAVFVVRDFAQKESGHYVLLAMILAALLSFGLADPFVAVASVVAFGASEIGDWLMYTITKKPFHERVLWSSVISTPIDTVVFLGLISGLTFGTFVLMVAAKLIAAVGIYWWYREPLATDEYYHNA